MRISDWSSDVCSSDLFVGQQRVEINRRLGHADALALGRNRAVQKGQRLAIVEPVDFGHEALDQMQNAVDTIEETIEQRFRIDAAFGAPFVTPIYSPRPVLGRRPGKRSVGKGGGGKGRT